MNDIDKRLIVKSQNGDITAFEKLIESYQKKVFNIALGIIGNYDDASELAQEVFIKIYKSINSFKGDSSFSTWIYRITTNVCLDEIRKRKKAYTVSLDEDIELKEGNVNRQIADERYTPHENFERKEINKVLRDSIAKLPEDQKIAVVLRDIQGFSYDEIAKYTNCSLGTVKSRINRARQNLRSIINENRELFDNNYVK